MATIIAYRGEHGPLPDNITDPARYQLRTRMASFTFSDREAAEHYARHPNNQRLDAGLGVDPRVIEAEITFSKPVIDTPDDPFLELADLIKAVGYEATKLIAQRHAQWVYSTSLWEEEFAKPYGSLNALLFMKPYALEELYLQAYPVFDDPKVIESLKALGFDGAIHAGNGEFSDSPEYRVFSSDQADIITVDYVVRHSEVLHDAHQGATQRNRF